MDEKYLLQDENIITQSDGKIITLTNQRVRYSEKLFGKAHIISILLNKISLIEVKYKSNNLILTFALFSFLGGAIGYFNNQYELSIIGLISGFILILLFFGTKKHVISIICDGGKEILFHTKGMKHENVLKFINQVEQSILAFKKQ